jgi:hypothetical protein
MVSDRLLKQVVQFQFRNRHEMPPKVQTASMVPPNDIEHFRRAAAIAVQESDRLMEVA